MNRILASDWPEHWRQHTMFISRQPIRGRAESAWQKTGSAHPNRRRFPPKRQNLTALFTNIRIYSYPNFSMVHVFKYIRIPIFLYLYSNIKYSAKNIRIFAMLCCDDNIEIDFCSETHLCALEYFYHGNVTWLISIFIWYLSSLSSLYTTCLVGVN